MNAEQIRKWREDAIADGWEHEPTYKNESEDTATKLNRGEWTARICLRPPIRKGFPRHNIHVWGPDVLAVKVPKTYDWKELQYNLKVCSRCNNFGETVHLGFAGRVCPKCREKYKAQVEYPGWTN